METERHLNFDEYYQTFITDMQEALNELKTAQNGEKEHKKELLNDVFNWMHDLCLLLINKDKK